MPKAASAPDTHFPSILELSEWTPRFFFDDDWACAICDAICDDDMAELRRLIDGDFDLNTTGKAGVTVLYWAYFDNNLEAFQVLLEAGADPDLKLTDFLRFKLHPPFLHGDSILFISLREGRYNFFVAAFPYTSVPKQLDGSKNTLLIAYARSGAVLDKRVIDAMVKGNVEFSAPDEYGCSAAFYALRWRNPRLCLELLKAGVDPNIRSNQGRTVSDLIDGMIHYPAVGIDLKECQAVRDWLDSHAAEDSTSEPTLDESPDPAPDVTESD